MAKKYISFILVFSLVFTILVPVSASHVDHMDNNTVVMPYNYPVIPGTDEWLSLSMDERIAVSYVDDRAVENMTTEAVLLTTLNYPFIVNIYAYNSTNEGIDVVKEYCPPLAELLIREDALQVITAYLNNATDTGSIEFYVAEKIWNYINDSSEVVPRYVIDPGTGLRVFYVETPRGTDVPVFKDLTWADHGTTSEEQSAINDVLQQYYGATSVRGINPSYNCHSYAWHSTSASNDYWMENPYYYISDGSYVAGTGAVGNKITYKDSGGTYDHSGIVTSSGIITSKWGKLGLFRHTVYACPYYVQNVVINYWKRS